MTSTIMNISNIYFVRQDCQHILSVLQSQRRIIDKVYQYELHYIRKVYQSSKMSETYHQDSSKLGGSNLEKKLYVTYH